MYTYAKILTVLFLMGITACQAKEKVIVETPSGNQAVFYVDVARTYQETQKGLMFVEDMPTDEGMIFLFPTPRLLKFWMKNTLISLDMLFFDANNNLIHVEHSATPHDLTARGPDVHACTVVELNGGTAQSYKIEKGSKLLSNLADECLQSSLK